MAVKIKIQSNVLKLVLSFLNPYQKIPETKSEQRDHHPVSFTETESRKIDFCYLPGFFAMKISSNTGKKMSDEMSDKMSDVLTIF